MNFDLTYSFMIPMLEFFAKATHSYGWSIVLLTLVVRMIVWPLVAKSTRSMQAMSRLQPQMKAMQEKYKDDKEQLALKMAEFYKENKMNPMGGCLPTLIQLPILFALFGTFTGPPFGDKPIDVKINVVQQAQAKEAHQSPTSGNNVPYVSEDHTTAKVVVFPGDSTVVVGEGVNFGTRAAQGELPASFPVEWKVFPKDTKDIARVPGCDTDLYHVQFNNHGEWHVQAKIPGVAKNSSFLFINSLGKVAKGADLLKPENFDSLALIILFGVTMYLSQKFTIVTPKVPDQEMDEQQKVQRDTMKMMPFTVTFMFFFIPLPTGVYLYMVVSNVMQTLQTWLIMKTSPPQLAAATGSGTVTMSPSGNSYSVDNGKDPSNGKKAPEKTIKLPNDKTIQLSTDAEDGQKLKVPKKKKKKK